MQIALVLLSAALMWASFPPLNLGFLVFFAPVPLLWVLRRVETARQAGWFGLVFGVAFLGGMLWWIFILGAVAWFPLTAIMGLWFTGYALVLFVGRNWSAARWWALAVGAWAAMEFLRARFPFGGFPWGSAGHPIGTIPGARGAAQWIGPTGWGVLVVAFAAGLAVTFEQERDRRWLEVSTIVIVVLMFLGALFQPSAGGPAVRVAVVQGNSPCPRVHCDGEKQAIYQSHLGLTSTIEDGAADLVVWPEDSFGGQFNPTFNSEVSAQMAGEAVRIGCYLIAGGTRSAGPGYFENLNLVFSPRGAIIGEYLKRHPVPFGEYVPLRNLFEVIPQLAQVPNDMVAGEGPVVFPVDTDDGERLLGSLISFEGAFERLMRSEVNAGARLMVVATNHGSYGRTPASDQFIGIVRMSAASFGVDVVHGAVTGRTTIIRADGSVERKTDVFEATIYSGVVRFQDSPRTFYSIAGDWLQLLAMAVGLIALIGFGETHRGFRFRPEVKR
jgi:apolipoprotein N-acyltransferase